MGSGDDGQTMGSTRFIAAAIAVLATLALAVPAGAGGSGAQKRPRPIVVEVHGATTHASLGSYCLT